MSRIIDQGLEEQTVLLTRMGELTYEALSLSICGYLGCKSVQTQVREMSDVLVAMAGKVEDRTFELIARFQPVASDLRAIKSYMKISNDFARYGRYALDISSISDQLHGIEQCETWIRDYLVEMGDKVLFMVKTSIDALRKHDVTLAKTISSIEREIDRMYEGFLNRLLNQEEINNKCIASSILVTRYFERIADHAVYVCESIVYIVTGEKISLS
ncbi:MAG: phosphate signaling complex protein PhoU [Nitrososphaerota archaeon]|jgi:phosphate transport system protein|uniref:phosphate signaling complex protein PhoU n=1 Tax=Candidatus Bathycorpusculum sp. TaxID=2994959 RepID=UPI00282BCC61|nr:phosphate signaling complex protein PhoU [Candidatus Termitimicrobium sp.]MCL2431084.1 phosphate signaling complex protein PhoU [Candidatus Termitimicrobium sp.]MDR0492219.1 phosphate signaling complex protein PhoU [Nitrososphaerota archaeon]